MLVKSLTTHNTVVKVSIKILFLIIPFKVVGVLFLRLLSHVSGLGRLGIHIIIISNQSFLFVLDQSTFQLICMHHHSNEFRMEILDQLIVEFDLTEGTGVLVFIPG